MFDQNRVLHLVVAMVCPCWSLHLVKPIQVVGTEHEPQRLKSKDFESIGSIASEIQEYKTFEMFEMTTNLKCHVRSSSRFNFARGREMNQCFRFDVQTVKKRRVRDREIKKRDASNLLFYD